MIGDHDLLLAYKGLVKLRHAPVFVDLNIQWSNLAIIFS